MMPQHFLFEVAAEDSGTRLDKYLAAHLPALSRSQLQRLIQEGQVGLAQGVVTASYRVRGGDIITVDVPPPPPPHPNAEALALQVVYEDDALIAVNKPAGLLAGMPVGLWSMPCSFTARRCRASAGKNARALCIGSIKTRRGSCWWPSTTAVIGICQPSCKLASCSGAMWHWCVDDSQHGRALLRHQLDAIPSSGRRSPSGCGVSTIVRPASCSRPRR